MGDFQHPDPSETDIPSPGLAAGFKEQKQNLEPPRRPGYAHPSGKAGHGRLTQVLRGLAFAIYFSLCCFTIAITQLIGAPLYFVNREWFYAYMAMTKRSFALTTTVMTQTWGPTTMRISGDESVAGQIRPTEDGRVQFSFPERMVLIANHQIYTDWLYLWWIGYVNRPGMHGHLYIILKESLRYIPIIGTGMMFYGFIFMSRKMATDQPRLAYRLNKLKQRRRDTRGKTYLDPMWLLLFPEGTNLSANGRRKSAQWAKKNGLKDPEHLMLPRSTGIFYCLSELKGTVDYVYDCTVAYEGISRGKYGEEIFGLASTYFQGRPPKSVNLCWRRFRVADIPLDDQDKFDLWLREQWYKKDALMEEYLTTGRFPAMAGAETDFIETSVRTRYPWEILQIFTVVGICGLAWNNVRKLLHAASKGLGLYV
ncbi:putative acyltransferase [Tolypocladium ophioglossoides CBS 100239]|uniref:Putative acyltransferase n=1 Tax=Tolypocladium ophioglossoides (strain CBS 100239) TaxID=1163406 RepID=A0A0L0N571_TOLOC|nr:putative acyltransferase [Tolypocladium ophioglossoides CBS 100239]